MAAREHNFDGLIGPTHSYAGLSFGNVASQSHAGQVGNPRRAALQGLEKMRFVASLGVQQAVLPPHERPHLRTLRRLGFRGSDEQVIAAAAASEGQGHLLRVCSSASAMWTANAATCTPSEDSADGKLHLVPANLSAMFHRAIEADVTGRALGSIFADRAFFEVHQPLPGGAHFSDEGAANHTRLHAKGRRAGHLSAWGRRGFAAAAEEPRRFPARQTREASQALALLGQVDPSRALFPQQHPAGIDAGAFHTDVLAVGNAQVLLLHELAFAGQAALLEQLSSLLDGQLVAYLATERELPVAAAVAAYPFNSQLLSLADGAMCIVAPGESRDTPAARAFLERVASSGGPVKAVHYLDVRDSMQNGGGPACLRLRVVLTDGEREAVQARVFFDEALDRDLSAWVERHYRDRMTADELRDPLLHREVMAALDELTRLLRLGSIYDFQS